MYFELFLFVLFDPPHPLSMTLEFTGLCPVPSHAHDYWTLAVATQFKFSQFISTSVDAMQYK